jgi:hypothetical protein
VGVVDFDLVGQQMQHFLSHFPRVLADMQELVLIGLEAGHEHAIFKYPEFAFHIIVMGIFAYFEMVDFFVNTNGDGVVFHSVITVGQLKLFKGNVCDQIPGTLVSLFVGYKRHRADSTNKFEAKSDMVHGLYA